MLKQPHALCNDVRYIYPGSLLLNGYHSQNTSFYSIPLIINGKECDTYAHCFVTDTHECRITDIQDNECTLWVVDHATSCSSCIKIEHKGDIKGCCFAKPKKGYTYAVTYSENDIIFSSITIHDHDKAFLKK